MFVLLIVHNVFNRRFYASIGAIRREARHAINVAITCALLAAMMALLVTSVLISHALSGVMSAYGGFTVRQIHTLAAYWVLVIVAIHLGLRWPMLMGVASTQFGITGTNALRIWSLRAVGLAIALCGVWSSFHLDMGTKLSMRVSLDWWNFEESVAAFFGHCLAIVGLYLYVTYYSMKWLGYGSVRASGVHGAR